MTQSAALVDADGHSPSGRGSVEKVDSLLNPRNVVIVGATDKPGNWPQRVWRNLHRYGFPGSVYPLNPSRDTVWDTRCYRSFAELPEPPDHIVVMVPARLAPATLRDAAAAGARSATVITSGFGELPDADSQALAAELKKAIDDTGLAVSGPNCLGNFNAASRLFTMPDDRSQTLAQGPVALIAQSGGMVMAMKRTLEERGIAVQALITSGNETGLTAADYIAYFAQAPGIRAIVGYVEGVRDAPKFLAACRAARAAGKPVVVVKLGQSEAGRTAAAAHTGALAGSVEAFDAVAGEAGVLRARTMDDMIEAVEMLVHAPLPKGDRVGCITFSGGMRGLFLDGAAHNRLAFRPLSPATAEKLTALLGVGSTVGNPLDGGAIASSNSEIFLKCVEIMLADPDFDLLLLQEEIPRAPGTERKEKNLRDVDALAAKADKPVAFVSVISYGLTDHSRTLRADLPHLAFLQETDRALRTVRSVADYAAKARLPARPTASKSSAKGRRLLARYLAEPGPATLDEVRSKALLAAYGIRGPREELTTTEDQAVDAARRIGFPVVAKLVSADLPHKSDAGGVIVNLESADAVRQAYRRIVAAVAALPGKPRLDGVLIAEMVTGGVELVLGASRDPEMGPVILFGSGGVDIELVKDVALAAPPLDERSAVALIERTRAAATKVRGHRGKPALDRDALVAALVGLSDLIADAGDRLDSIDINPFLLRPMGGVALDALVVLARDGTAKDEIR